MLDLGFEKGRLRTVLCLGAHADDIEIGCGGTILELARCNPKLQVVWVVFSAKGDRRKEAAESARAFLQGVARPKIIIKSFRDGFFPTQLGSIKTFFEVLKAELDPDLVLTHYLKDRHQDHRVLSELAWNTFRNHLILEYEIPKYDGDLGNPNVYFRLDESVCHQKVKEVCKHFQTQGNKHWFSEDTFLSIMRLRGIECGPSAKFAEAFYSRKLVMH